MPQDALRAIAESNRKRYLADLEDEKFREQKKKEEEAKKAKEQREKEKEAEEEAKKSEDQKRLENFLFYAPVKLWNIHDEERSMFYYVITWIGKIERRIQELNDNFQKLKDEIGLKEGEFLVVKEI